MEQKPKYKLPEIFLTALILLVLLVFLFVPISLQVKAATAFVPFGGRILYFSPPFATGFVNCPPFVAVENIGGPYKGILFLAVPPAQPKMYYNFYTPGVAVLGNFVPFPIPINCYVAPIYPSNIFGTSASPTF